MRDTYEKNRQELTEWMKKAEYLKYTLNSMLYWDKITHMPPGGIEYRSQVMGFLGEELYKLLAGSRPKELMDYFKDHSRNDHVMDEMLHRLSRNTMYVAKIPQAEYTDYIQLVANAEQVWETARKENNFLLIQPYLERLLVHYKNFAEYWGYKREPYDAWLGYYEEGFDSERMDGLIAQVKPAVLHLLAKLRTEEEREILPGKECRAQSCFDELPPISREVQRNLTKRILKAAGFSFHYGRVDEGAHPTILSNSPMDVRLVTSFQENDLRPCIFNAVYLAGKGLYEQEIDCGLLGTMLAEVSSFALEEGVGRFYENQIGRSRAFWEFLTPILKEELPDAGGILQWESGQLFQEVNRINITPVRLDADELTYMLHIIIRYELERELMNGTLSVSELQDAWNDKYAEYLSIVPRSSGEGVLQDIHWVAGYFGYFASYLLSDLISAQLAHCIKKENAGFEMASAEKQLSQSHEWLKENVFRFGGLYPSAELIERACGEPLKADYYVEYLEKRFHDAYKLN